MNHEETTDYAKAVVFAGFAILPVHFGVSQLAPYGTTLSLITGAIVGWSWLGKGCGKTWKRALTAIGSAILFPLTPLLLIIPLGLFAHYSVFH